MDIGKSASKTCCSRKVHYGASHEVAVPSVFPMRWGRAINTDMIPSSLAKALHRVLHGSSKFELIHTPHDHWPLSQSPSPVSVLDSSFNPPTLAHLALAKSQPPTTPTLLLLSVRNADKSLKPTDATYFQRIEMMYLLAQDSHPENTAIAIIDEPTFVGKSTTLLNFFRHSLSVNSNSLAQTPKPSLTFLVGTDTLTRLFAPRYYQSEAAMTDLLQNFFSPSSDDSSIICAHRNPTSYASGAEGTPHHAVPYIQSGKIKLIEIGADEQTFSSSEVRSKRVGDGDGEAKRWKQLVSPRIANYIEEKGLYLPA